MNFGCARRRAKTAGVTGTSVDTASSPSNGLVIQWVSLVMATSGWDGVFVWEGAYGVDAWSLLAAMAVRTKTVRLGTMLTPLP